jgi:hypothetical protein
MNARLRTLGNPSWRASWKAPRIAPLTVTLMFAATACASIPSQLHQGSSVQNPSVIKTKPSVYLDVKFFDGKPGEGDPLELPAVQPTVQGAVERIVDRAGIFSRYSFDPFAQDKMDQVIHLSFYHHGGGVRSDFAALLCGLTLGLVPTSATDQYTLVASVTEKGQPVGPTQTSDDSITTQMGIWFVSGMNDTMEKAEDATYEDLTRDALKKLIDSEQIRLTP